MEITSPSIDSEVALALRVLERCCLIHYESNVLAHQYKAFPVLMNILSTRAVLGQGACLDALIAIMLDSSANQTNFNACNGIEEVAILIRHKQVDEKLRQNQSSIRILILRSLSFTRSKFAIYKLESEEPTKLEKIAEPLKHLDKLKYSRNLLWFCYNIFRNVHL